MSAGGAARGLGDSAAALAAGAEYVAAFTGPRAQGNLAAVIQCDRMPQRPLMQAAATAIACPASAFIAAAGKARYRVRWFSPRGEIALCGHGALAAGHVLLARSGGEALELVARTGTDIAVRRLDGKAHYELALPAIATVRRDMPQLSAALGARPIETRWNAAGYAIALFPEAQAVRALEPDRAELARLGPVQLIATAPGDADSDVVSRVFTAQGEDAATGSAHAALAPYWCARLGAERFSAAQASARGGWFECRSEGGQVWLAGRCLNAAREG